MLISFLIALPLLVLGVFMRKGKGLFLLAGYNTMPKSQQDKIDKDILGKKAGNLLLRTGLYTAAIGAAILLNINYLSTILFFLILIDTTISIVLLNKIVPKEKGSSNKGIIAVVIILGITIAGSALLFVYGEKDPVVSISDTHISISGMYGIEIPLEKIDSIVLHPESMAEIGIGQRTNGYGGFGEALKGTFNSPENGRKMLFVQADTPNTIEISRSNGTPVFISLRSPEDTAELYYSLQQAM